MTKIKQISTTENRMAELDKIVEIIKLSVEENKKSIQRIYEMQEQAEKKAEKRRQQEAAEEKKRKEKEAAEEKKRKEKEAAEEKKRQEEVEKEMAEIRRITKENGRELWAHQKTASEVLEDAVYQNLSEEKTIAQIKFDKIAKNVKDLNQREYDVVLQNGKYTALVEVKYKAKARDIDKLLDDQIDALREGFKLPKEQKIIPAIATKILSDDVKNVAEKKGVVLMAQNGEELQFRNSPNFRFKTY